MLDEREKRHVETTLVSYPLLIPSQSDIEEYLALLQKEIKTPETQSNKKTSSNPNPCDMKILDLNLSKVKKNEFLSMLKTTETPLTVFTPNPEIVLKSRENPEFRKTLEKANYLIPDGIGIFVGAQIADDASSLWIRVLKWPWYILRLFTSRRSLYERYGERICGSDVTRELVEYANERGLGVTIIDKFQAPGNKWDNLKIEQQKVLVGLLEKKFPNAKFHLYIYTPEKEEAIIDAINATDDVYLFSTQGYPAQEETPVRIMPKLRNIRVAMGIGGSFDLILGLKPRAPRIFIALGVEWLWRLLIDGNKTRMLKRIWRAIFVFLWEVSQE